MHRVIVLSSIRNHSWASMQEIVPHLVDQWLDCSNQEYDINHFDLDRDNFRQVVSACFQADTVVMTIFTLPLLHFVKSLREKFDLQFRFVFHLHGFATFACWPLYHWGLGQLLTLDDVFVASSQADYISFKSFFPQARCHVIPFSLPRPKHSANTFNEEIPVLYVGRLSEQKHLEHSLLAVKKLLDRGRHLHFHIYGAEDKLGSPHMGERNKEGYEDFLQNLTTSLGLSKHVTFYGFKKREEIDREWQHTALIFLSPSLHSDENFGMAAFRYLLQGNCAVLSEWGGHIDLIHHFSKALGVVVRGSSLGPWMSVDDISKSLESAMNIWDQDTQIPGYYYRLSKDYRQILDLPKRTGQMEPPPVIEEIEERLLKFQQGQIVDDSCRIFSGYGDPLAMRFFHHYGMKY